MNTLNNSVNLAAMMTTEPQPNVTWGGLEEGGETTTWDMADDSNSSTFNQSRTGNYTLLITIFDYPGVTEVYIFACCIVWLLCVVGNCLVLTVMMRSPSLRTRTNLFLCHLAVADLSVGLFCIIPRIVVAAGIIYWVPEPAGRMLCKLYNFYKEFSLTASVLLLVLIAVERYVVILHPLKARQLFTRFRMYACLSVVWLAAFLYNVPLMMIYETATLPGGYTYCFRYDIALQSIRMDLYHLLTFILTYLLPLLLMGSMYLRISLTLWKSSPANLLQRAPTTEREGGTSGAAGRGSQGNSSTDSKRTDSDNRGKEGESRNSSITSHTSHTSCSSSASLSKTPTSSGSEGGSNNSSSNSSNSSTEPCGATPAVSRPLLLACRSDPCPEEDAVPQPAAAANLIATAWDMPASSPSAVRPVNSPANAMPRADVPTRTTTSSLTAASSGSCGGTTVSPPALKTRRIRDGVYALRSAAASNNTTTCHYHVPAQRVLQARRKVVRLLVAVLLVFAFCVLPFHLKLLIRYGLKIQESNTTIGLLDFLSQLLFFLNSALNPVLYSLMSYSFRRSARQVLCCDTRAQRH